MKMNRSQWTRLAIFSATILFIVTGTILMIRYAKGYRPTRTGTIKGTGLLAANSYPTAAEVYINGRLTTATDNTLNLDPGEYSVEIKKDGYHSWIKNLTIEEELVTQTSATLFPTSPSLEPLSFTGAVNPIPSPDGNRIVYAVASASAVAKNGLYVQDLSSSPISLNKNARQIARSSGPIDYIDAKYTWSPSGSQILVELTSGDHFLLETDRFNDLATLKDVTVTLGTILSDWEKELSQLETVRLNKLPSFFQDKLEGGEIANLYFSPDGDRILYQAQTDVTIPIELKPPIPASSTQPQERLLTKNSWYVYDLEEDRNFVIASSAAPDSEIFTPTKLLLIALSTMSTTNSAETLVATPASYKKLQTGYALGESMSLLNAQYSPIFVGSLQWFPDSTHLVATTESGIDILEYDGKNRVTIYGGPFDHNFVYSWPDASRLVTRIQFSPDTIPNLYTIKLK